MKKIIKSCVAMLLALCMVCGMLPAMSVSAAQTSKVMDTNGDGKITYVSFGDSVTNGYGMEDYRYENGSNVYGFRRAPKNSYPTLIKNYLEGQGYEVEQVQMAISGFRMDDLAWMLNDKYEPDSYHYYWFDDWNEHLVNEYAKRDSAFAAKYNINGYVDVNRANSIVMSEYREAVANADLVTIDLGTNNFGTFMTNTVMSILNQKPLAYEIDFTQYMDEKTAVSLEAMLGQMVANMVGGSDTTAYQLAMELARCLMYGYLGYTENYDLALEGLYQINPDAQVVVIDCYSMITGVDLAGGALGGNVDLDQLYNMFIDLANFYSRELSPYAHKVTHATLNSAPELFIDYYKYYPDANWPNNQYLDPNAERLMNEFLMEAMGYNADKPAEREAFQKNVLDNIQLLDSYVNNLQETVDTNIISGVVDPIIKEKLDPVVELVNAAIDGVIAAKSAVKTATEGVATAEVAVDKAIEGVAAANDAVDAAVSGVATATDAVKTARDGVATATEAVDTAVNGVASAQNMVNMIVDKVVNNRLFGIFASISKDRCISTIKDELEGMDLTAYGYTSDDIDALAEEIYNVALAYKNNSDKTAANKDAVIEIIRFNLAYKMGYSEDEAVATANQAWEMNEIVKAQGKPAAIKAAIKTAVTSDMMALLGVDNADAAAELIYTLGSLEEADAVKAAIELKLDDATLAMLGTSDKKAAAAIVYELGTVGATDKVAAVKAAIKLKLDDATLAMLGTSDKDIAAATVYELGTAGAMDKIAAVKAAIKLKLDDATLAMLGTSDKDVAAEFVYTIGKMEDKDAAVKAVLMYKLNNDEATVNQALQLYAVYEAALNDGADDAAARSAAIIAAMVTVAGYDSELAQAIYAVYSNKDKATYAQKQLAYISLMTGQKVGDQTISNELATAIFKCYAGDLDENNQVISLDGQFTNEDVQTTMVFLMMQGLGMDQDKAVESYKSYLMYKNLPTTLSKIAKCKTIYFDALLAEKPDMGAVAEKFKSGKLVLDEPEKSEAEDPAAWAKYKADSALATMYFRFITQEGIFTHPSEAGQIELFEAAKKAINNILMPDVDQDIEINADTKMLVLGDFITGDTNTSYVKAVADKLGIDAANVTNLSNPDFRINEVRALLDSSYEKDAYAKAFIPANVADYEKAVQENDLIVLNLGAMNMGLIAKQLGTYMVDGSTYGMEFSNLGNMQAHNLGKTMDGFLNNFSGAFGTDAIGALMLAFESYGYGFTTFADSMAATVEKIQELNPDADIVLVGMYDLLGDAYVADGSGLHLELGHFIGHAVNLMNQRMEIYADMTGNVTYVDVTGVQTNVQPQDNLLASGIDGIGKAFKNATPTADGYAEMAQRIICAMGLHEAEKAEDITWEWNDNALTRAAMRFAARAKFHCIECDEDVVVNAKIAVSETAPTCTDPGSRVYTASFGKFTCPVTKTESLDPTGHDYKPTWSWNADYTEATLTMTCATDTAHVATQKAAITTATTEAKCEADGKIVYTATAVFEGKTYTDQKEDSIPASGHSFGEWQQTKAPTCDVPGEKIHSCNCGATETSPVSATGHNYTSTVVPSTCTKPGYTSYTCDNCGDSYATDVSSATGHSYGENGLCHCGEVDPDAHPVCEYRVGHTLESGKTYILNLGGSDVGSYTFTQVSGGWTIQSADGKYLAIENKALTSSASAFTWTFSNNTFSAVVKGSSSSNNWWGGSFGNWWGSGSSSNDTTYYLVASGNSAAISTSSTGAAAGFYTNESNIAHKFDTGVVSTPSCTEGGHTTYTCERCGYSYNGSYTSATGHTYESVVTAPTCDEEGCTTYTCSKCGDSYKDNITDALGHQYESAVFAPTCSMQGYTEHTCSVCGDQYKDNFEDALDHDFQDGICTECGDAEQPEHPVCEYRVEAELEDGLNPLLNIGGTDLGYFIFTKNGNGWNIIDDNDQYLALDGSKLIRSNAPFAWTYSNNTFSAKVTTQSSGSSNNWWGGSFGNWWGSSSSTTTTYYLVASNGAPAVSTSNSGANVKLYFEFAGDHFFMDPVSRDGNHVFICENCGYDYAEPCTNADCELCHPPVPEATIRVSVSVTSTSSGSSWFDRFFGSSKKTYTATISVEAEGTEIESVAYSTSGGSIWAEGTSFTSSSNITNFDIRVIATNGETYYFTYNNGTVTQK